jgi:hypothetical protein
MRRMRACHHGEADVPVDADLAQGACAQGALDQPAVPGGGEPQQLLVGVGEVVVLVVGDHAYGSADLGMVGEVPAQHQHLVGGALFGDPAR